jgi:serine phosphatase RsbU (regulator of sigma subunit)
LPTDAGFPSGPPDRPDAARISLLLVEDDDGDAFLVRELLDGTRIDVHVARTLAEARGRLAGVDCVLLDLGLPDARGLDGLRRIRAEAGRVPVVVLTGLEDESLGVAALAAGAQDYLFKGYVNAHGLTRTVRYAVQRRHVEDVESALLEERLRADENLRLERGLLPQPLVFADDLRVTTRYRPGGGRILLGGDFYDVVQSADGRVHAIIGDVAGHGPDEAAVGVALRIAWRTLIIAERPADEILRVMDQLLGHERHTESLLATVCTVSVSADRRTAVAHVAGHPPPFLWTGGKWTAAPTAGGPSLGLIEGARFPATGIALPPDWRLLLYTDGLIEGYTGDDGERLGDDGLLTVLNDDADAETDLDALTAEVIRRNAGPLTDDLALLLMMSAGPPR